MLKPGIVPESLGERLASVLPPARRAADYDGRVEFYDRLIGNGIYNRLVWGVGRSHYHKAAVAALAGAQTTGEKVLDCGCGSLVFTFEAYRLFAPQGMILFDRSLDMLSKARLRVPRLSALQGDALDMPFADGWFDRTLAWGLVHVLGSDSRLFAEMARVTRKGGQVHCSTLVLAGRAVGDRVLDRLVDRGHVAHAETAHDVALAFARHFDVTERKQVGNMLFLSGRKR